MPRATVPDLGLALTCLRSAAGWSQRELAAAAGITPNLLSDYERGRKLLHRNRLAKLVRALGFDTATLDRALSFIDEVHGDGSAAAEPRTMALLASAALRPEAQTAPGFLGRIEPGELRKLLVQLRLLRGWNQKQLAAAAGIPASSLSTYESGRKAPSRRTVARLVSAAAASPPDLARIVTFITGARVVPLDQPAGDPRLIAPAGRGNGESQPAATAGAAPVEVTASTQAERSEAHRVWSRLERHTHAGQRVLVERHRGMQTWALCELLGFAKEARAALRLLQRALRR